MPVLRFFLSVQLAMFLFLPPVAVAVVAFEVRWLLIGIPWALLCVFLFGWNQGRGLLYYEEEKYLPLIHIGAADSVHRTLLAVNGLALAAIGVAVLARSV